MIFSIIVPTYNRADLLACALESVRAQEFSDFELIVVDDGSTDDTPALLARELADGRWAGRLRVLSQANAGQGAARNRAIAEARGEYCAFLDSDDLMFPWSLAVVAEAIAANGRPALVLGQEKDFATAADFARERREPLRYTTFPDFYSCGSFGPAGRIVVRTEALREVGGFLTRRIVGEDADLLLRLGVAKRVVKIEAPGTYGYRIHAGMFTTQAARWAAGARESIRRFRSGAYPGGAARASTVRAMVAFNAAWCTQHCLRAGARWECLKLYVRTFAWQARAGSYGYLLKTPIRFALNLIGQWPRGPEFGGAS